MSSEEACKIIPNDLKAAFLTEAIQQGMKCLEPLNPFFDIDPLINEDNQTTVEKLARQDEIDLFATWLIKTNENLKECY